MFGILLAALVLAATGCKAVINNQGAGASGTPTAAASVTPQPRSGAMAAIHDPKQVTYSITETTCHALQGPRPDAACTPGSYDPAVNQADISTTICHSGYTATVRPSTEQTDAAKKKLYTAYGLTPGTVSELDHLVPLELGGSNDVTNLWPEAGSLPNPKDKVENDLKDAVCSGKVPLDAARQAIASDWTTAEHVLGLS